VAAQHTAVEELGAELLRVKAAAEAAAEAAAATAAEVSVVCTCLFG